MIVEDVTRRLESLRNMHGAVQSLIQWAHLVETESPGLLDALFTQAEQSGTVNVRNKIEAEIARIEALEF